MIEYEFNIGDFCWSLRDGVVRQFKITARTTYESNGCKTRIEYTMAGGLRINSNRIFGSVQGVLDYLKATRCGY